MKERWLTKQKQKQKATNKQTNLEKWTLKVGKNISVYLQTDKELYWNKQYSENR